MPSFARSEESPAATHFFRRRRRTWPEAPSSRLDRLENRSAGVPVPQVKSILALKKGGVLGFSPAPFPLASETRKDVLVVDTQGRSQQRAFANAHWKWLGLLVRSLQNRFQARSDIGIARHAKEGKRSCESRSREYQSEGLIRRATNLWMGERNPLTLPGKRTSGERQKRANRSPLLPLVRVFSYC